jgi:hypothetical protein
MVNSRTSPARGSWVKNIYRNFPKSFQTQKYTSIQKLLSETAL